uniref:HMA domain-containing protein n=1 Tax=Physcomitrium patens TaxID=3218 RepID=A0A7I4FMK8_PHYPA
MSQNLASALYHVAPVALKGPISSIAPDNPQVHEESISNFIFGVDVQFTSVAWKLTVEISVVMHCEGCAATVKRTLKKIPGVTSYTVNYKEQKATVVGEVDADDVVRRIRKSGKAATLISATATPSPPPEPPKEEAKSTEEKTEETTALVEEGKSKNKGGKSPRKIFRPKMPKMPEAKMPKSVTNVLSKFPDCRNLSKGISDSRNMPKFMGEFMSKGVFYASF